MFKGFEPFALCSSLRSHWVAASTEVRRNYCSINSRMGLQPVGIFDTRLDSCPMGLQPDIGYDKKIYTSTYLYLDLNV